MTTGFFARLVHRFGSKRRTKSVAHRRLALVDATRIDQRRHLILIRRDNIEHLMMIGGPTDIVIEANVVRAAEREPALARPGAFPEATQRSAVTANGARPPQVNRSTVQETEASDQRAAAQELRGPRERETDTRLSAEEAGVTLAADPEFAETTQRLVEEALRRHRKPGPDAEGEPGSRSQTGPDRNGYPIRSTCRAQ